MYQKIVRQDQNPLGYGTTLPASPYDGQEYVLVDSTSAPNYAWRMRFNIVLGKWEYMGGRAKLLAATPNAVLNTLTQVGATGSYRNTGTDFVVPYGGTWNIDAQMNIDPNGAAAGTWNTVTTFVGSAVANDLAGGQGSHAASGVGTVVSYPFAARVTASAGNTIGVCAGSTVPGTVKVAAQSVRIYPEKII